jgi:hypothetical protein
MFQTLNYLHIAAAALVYFIIGAVWYSLLFQKAWMALIGVTPTEADKKGMPLMFGMTFILNLVITFATAGVLYFVSPNSILASLKVGALLGVCLVAPTTAMNYMYAKRPFKLTLIDSGYHVVAIMVVSVILSLWH